MPTYYGQKNGFSQLRVDVSWTQSVTGNYSDVRAIMYILCDQWVADSGMGVGLAFQGNVVYENIGYVRYEAGTNLIADQTYRVFHNSAGNASVTINGAVFANFTGLVNVSIAINTLTLPTIPREPSAPTRPSALGFTTTSMIVKFNSQGTIPATSFQLQRSLSSDFSNATTITSTGTSTISGLTPGTTYYFRARSLNAAGASAWSPALTTYTLIQTNTPTADSITAQGARLAFGRTGGAAGGASFELQRATNAAFTTGVVTVGSTGTTVVSGLIPGTTYYFRSRGTNASGTGPWSGTRTVTTLTVAAPGLAVVSGATGASASATITAPSGAQITSYTIEAEYLAPLPIPGGANKTVTSTTTVVTVNALIPGASYRWRVRANISTYSTAWSAWVTVTQIEPNTVSATYFDATTPSTDPDVTRTTATISGITVQVENAVTPKYWVIPTQTPTTRMTLRRITGSIITSAGSTRLARARVIQTITPANPSMLVLTGSSSATIAAIPGADHTGMIYVRATKAVTMSINFKWMDDTFAVISRSTATVYTPTAGRVTQLRTTGLSPENSAFLTVELNVTSAEWGTLLDLDGGFVGISRPEAYFDGGTTDTTRYDYAWQGTPRDSISLRNVKPLAVGVSAFTDPNCPQPPAAPLPPVPVNDCLPVVPVWRRFWSPIESTVVSSAFDSLLSVTITTTIASVSPLRVSLFENPDNLAPDVFVPGIPLFEQTVTFIPADSTVVLDAVSARAYGSVAGGEWEEIDHLTFGPGGGPVEWPVLGCGQSYVLAVDVPGASPPGNVSITAETTQRMG